MNIEKIKKLKNEEGTCPFCGSSDLHYNGLEIEPPMCYYPWTCNNCHKQGEEWHKMEFVGHNVYDSTGELIELESEKEG